MVNRTELTPLQQWRMQALNWILQIALVVATPTAVLTGINAFSSGRLVQGAIYLGGFVVIAILTFARHIPFVIRAGFALAICYGVGLTALGVTSVFGTGPMYIMTFILLAAFLFGLRVGIVAVLLSVPPLLWAVTLVLSNGPFVASAHEILHTPMSLSISVLTLLGISILFLTAIVSLASRLSQSLQSAEQLASAAVNARRHAEEQAVMLAQQMEELEQQYQTERQLRSLVATLEAPIVTLAKGVLLATIVGIIDQQRSQALVQRLLQVVYDQHAHTLVLDVTGVATIDDQVAHTLVQATQALFLLGCRVVMTGVTAQVAATIVQRDMNITGLVTAQSPQEVLGMFNTIHQNVV